MKRPAVRGSIPDARYLFFGGKGGVGKTSCATSTALLLAERAPSTERILLFSTDPAHSLADGLALKLNAQITEVARPRAALDAWEMDATAALNDFKQKHHTVLKTIADRGTLLDENDINDLLNLSLPGLDEVMALFALSEFDRQDTYSRIVVDTAPSGHTTRLLQLPQVFERWIHALDRMSDKHRYMVAKLARRTNAPSDDVELFLRDLSLRVERVREILYTAGKSAFVLVTIPELMAVEETLRYSDSLLSQHVPVTHLVINRVETVRASCDYCRARRAAQQPHLRRLWKSIPALKQRQIPLLPFEVRGFEHLREFGELLWTTTRTSAGKQAKAIRPSTSVASMPPLTSTPNVLPLPQLSIVGGKGGVGKTTTAAAMAIALARQHPDRRFLVFSTDPAHSLTDSFGESIGPIKEGLAGQPNLDGTEIDAAGAFEELKVRYKSWIEEIFTALTGGSNWEVQFDREAMQELIALAPPGIDEIAALSRISDFLEKGTYTSIVLDTAPTGHLLRFLELPELALAWVRTFIKFLLKYRNVVTSSNVAEELIALSKSIKRVMAVLKDPRRCGFTAVAIPERMSLAETVDLVKGVGAVGISLERVLVNNVLPEFVRRCGFCAQRRQAQAQVLTAFRTQVPTETRLWLARQLPAPVQGPELLQTYFENWSEWSRPIKRSARGRP